jgi:hypothetical protein
MKRALIVVGVVVALYILPVPHSPNAYVLLLLLLGYSELRKIRKSLEHGERSYAGPHVKVLRSTGLGEAGIVIVERGTASVPSSAYTVAK